MSDLDTTKIDVLAGWLVYQVDGCTCGGDGYHHERGCGYEPIATLDHVMALLKAETDQTASEPPADPWADPAAAPAVSL